jgi:hypothetical protein
LKSKREDSARFGVGRTEYVDDIEPVSGVMVSVIVYGKEECETLEGVRRLWPALDSRAADVPANGLFEKEDTERGTSGGGGSLEGARSGARVVNRNPVDNPMTCEKGL